MINKNRENLMVPELHEIFGKIEVYLLSRTNVARAS